MQITTQTIQLPKVLFDYWKRKKVAEKKITQTLVLELVKEGEMTQGKAAELLNISRWDLMGLMARYNVPTANFDTHELERQVEDARTQSA